MMANLNNSNLELFNGININISNVLNNFKIGMINIINLHNNNNINTSLSKIKKEINIIKFQNEEKKATKYTKNYK